MKKLDIYWLIRSASQLHPDITEICSATGETLIDQQEMNDVFKSFSQASIPQSLKKAID